MNKIDIISAGCVGIFSIWAGIDVITGNIGFIADHIYLAVLSLLVLLLHRKMQLSVPIVLIGLIPIILHSIGWYHVFWLGVPFDLYLHFFSGLAIGLIFYEYMKNKNAKLKVHNAVLAVFITAGLGSFLEVFEYIGYTFGGAGTGIFFYGAGDFGEWANASKDMIANTFGAIFGVGLYSLLRKPKQVIITIASIIIVLTIAIYIHSAIAYSQVDPHAPDDFKSIIDTAGIPQDLHQAELKTLLDQPISNFQKGDIFLIMGRLKNDRKTMCQSVQFYEEFIHSSYSPEMTALTYETLASLNCPESGPSRNDYLSNAAEIWKTLGNEFRYRLDTGLIENNSRFYFKNYTINKNVTTKSIIGTSRMELNTDDFMVTQVDRVTRDWLSAQLENVPDSENLLRVFSEKYFLDETELMRDIGWHEGARIEEIRKAGIVSTTATGTIVKKIDNKWFAPNEKGIFIFEVPEDKILYPTTRYLREDLAMVIDTHGINMIVSQAIRKGATVVLGCCDFPGKVQAADYLSGKGIKVICPTDRMTYQLVGSLNSDNIIGSAPFVITGNSVIFGNRPINIGGVTIVASTTSETNAIMYYDTPARYLKAIGADFTSVNLDDLGQLDRVTNKAREINTSIISVRIFNKDDYDHIKEWLDEDMDHRAILLHSLAYPYGYKLFQEYPEQTSFGDIG